MSIDSRISSFENVFEGWKIGEFIGGGSGGKSSVYEISRKNFDFVEEDVIKIINIIEDIGLQKMTESSRENYEISRDELVMKAEEEVKLMNKLRYCRNIIPYQDFKFYYTTEDNYTAVDLAIRMHKYMDLNSLAKTKELSQKDIIQIGIDICTALEECAKHGIIHRDIKPENIFYDNNQYLLGDFGISKIIQNGVLAQTSRGTPTYAAPEQFDNMGENKGYDYRVDIYSLGLTLYVLANKGKLPFVSKDKSISLAIKMRLVGNEIQPIEDIDSELNRIILKACSYSREDRYSDCKEMKSDLLALQKIIKKAKKTEKNKAVDMSFETQQQMSFINNYATEQAMKDIDIADYSTETALPGNLEKQSFATIPALKVAGITDNMTQPALKIDVEEYVTEPALKIDVEEYTTEPALKIDVEEYATEPALKSSDLSTEDIMSVEKKKTLKDAELGISVASIDTQDMPAANGNDADYSANLEENVSSENSMDMTGELSKEEIIKKAISEMMEGNNEQAFSYFATLAENDDWDSMYNEVTKLFNNEIIISNRVEDAIFWFTKCVSCCKDSWTVSLAEFQLGDIYAKGIGVKKNHKIAEKYYSSSASKGNPYAKKKFVAGKYVK